MIPRLSFRTGSRRSRCQILAAGLIQLTLAADFEPAEEDCSPPRSPDHSEPSSFLRKTRAIAAEGSTRVHESARSHSDPGEQRRVSAPTSLFECSTGVFGPSAGPFDAFGADTERPISRADLLETKT